MGKKINVEEQVKADVSAEKTAAIMEDLEHSLKSIATGIKCNEEEHTFHLSGINAGLAVAEANLALKDKNGKYILEGDITGKPSTLFWIVVGAGALVFFGGSMLAVIVMLFSFLLGILMLPFAWIGLIVAGVAFFMMNKKLPNVGKSITESFVKAVRD